MDLDLEIIDYDLEGAAYKDGHVVDAAFLLAKVRRRQTVVDGVVTVPAGDPTILRLPVEDLDSIQRKLLFAAFEELEYIVRKFATDHYAAQTDSTALDKRVGALAHATAEHDRTVRSLEARRAELAEIDRFLDAKRAEAAKAAEAAQSEDAKP